MRTVDLYKFVHENEVEYHYHDGDVFMMPTLYQTVEFNRILTGDILDDAGINCLMRDGYFVFEMDHICGYYGIELFDVFGEDDSK